MENYRCPLCEKAMERNLVLFLTHTKRHIIDRIKEEHPEWVEKDGVCKPCAEYYERQLSGEGRLENIGPAERRKRVVMGMVALISAVVLAMILAVKDVPGVWFLPVFAPLFLAMLGFLQSRGKTCTLLAERGLQNLDGGEGKVQDPKIARQLKRHGRLIILKSIFMAAILTAAAGVLVPRFRDELPTMLRVNDPELMTLLTIMEKYKTQNLEIVWEGSQSTPAAFWDFSIDYLKHNFESGDDAENWIKEHCYRTSDGQVIYFKYPDGTTRPMRDVFLEELVTRRQQSNL